MIGSPQEIPGTPTIRNTEAIVRLQKVFSFAEGGTIQLHGAKIELRGGVNIDEERKGTPIETVGKGKKQTNLVDFLQEDTSIQAILEKAIREDVLKAGQLRAVKLPIASVTTGTEVAQKLDLSKPLTNIQKAEAIGLILQNIGQGKFIEGIADTMNKKLKRTGDFVAIPFMQMDYLNALTAAGGQSLLNAVREADYRPYQINDIDKTRRKVSSSVSPIRSENLRREIAEVTEDQGMNVFEPVKKVVEGIKGKKPVPELQESPSVDLKAAQLMFNLFLPPSELLAMNRLELQIGRETNLGKKESLRHELVKKRQTNYIALLQANGVKGYEANGPIVKGLIEKGVLTVEEVNSIQGEMVKGAKKIMGRKIHELSLHDANIESLIQTFSGNYNKQEGSNVNVTGQIRNAFNSIEISHDTITKLEREFETKGFSKSERTRKAYEQLWEQFSGALKNGGLEVAHKKGETSQETADTEEALKLFFLDRVRTELGMTERKIKFESGFKDPSDVRLSDVEDWGIKGLDLLYRRTQSTQVYKDVGDYDEKMRTLLQKIASQEEPSEGRSAVLVQETKIPKKLDAKTETLQKTLEKNLPNTPPVEKLTKEQADNLSQALGEVISAQLKIGQEPSAVLLDAVGSLVTAENPEFHLSADLLFRIVLGEAVQTPAGKVIIDKLLPQILQTLRDQPQRLEQILGVLDRQQQNGETPDEVAKKLITLIDKYEPSVVKPVAAAPEYTVRRGPDNKLILKMPNGVDINIPNDSIVGVIDQVKEQLVKTPGNESQKKTLSALEALQFAELKAKLENKVSAPLPAASSATSAAAPISATTAPLPTSTAEPVSFESSLQHPAVARAFPSRAAAGAPVTVETAAAAAVPTEVRPLTVTHGVLKVGKNKNGNIVITQPEDKNDDLTGRVLPDGASEFVFSPEDINIVINEAESRLDATLKSDRTNPLRNTRVHNEGLVVDALYEYKRAEVAQSLETHLTALGISKDKVTSRREGKVIVFEVADPVTVPFSGETSEQLKALNEAATTAQRVELHLAQLNLAPVEKVGEKSVGLQLPAEVGTMVAKAGAEGVIGINRVGTLQLEGKTNVILNKGGEGRSSVGAIEITYESALTISPQLAKDLNGQKVRLNLPESQTGLQGYVGPGEYVVETTEKGDITVRPSLPIGGTQPPRPPPSSAPPPQPTSAEDLDIPAFLRRRAGSSTFPPPTLSSTPPAPTTPTPLPTAATAAPATVTPPPSEPHTESKPGFRERFKKFVNEHVEKPPRPLNDEQVLVSNLEFEPEITNHLQAITARFNLEDSPENNKIKDALAEELNKLAEGKHKEKELPAFVESLLADQEAAVQFVDAIHQYADDYNERTKRSFLQKKLSIISHRATPMREDAFGVDHIFLDRMTDDLVHEVNRRQITTAFTYGRPHADLEIYDDRRDFIHDVMLRLELNQGESSTELAIKTIQALLNIPDEQFSDLQRETVISLEELVGDVSGSDQTIALKTVITDRLPNTFEAYARKYNQERGGRIRNKNPFGIDFPELANLLDESA